MKCPAGGAWDLLAVGALGDEKAERLLAHARTCAACRERLRHARQMHTQLVRAYEAFDRDHDQLREEFMAALPPRAPADVRAGGWRPGGFIMRMTQSRPRRLAAMLVPAACVVAAVSIFLASGQRSALAAALEHLQAARTIVCHISMPEGLEVQGMSLKGDGMLYMSDAFGTFSTIKVNGMVVSQSYAPPDGPLTVVQPLSKTYMKIDVSGLDPEDINAQNPGVFLEQLAQLKAEAATELGTRTIGGHEAIGYRIPGDKLGFGSSGKDGLTAFAELWVATETNLPVELSVSVPMPQSERPLVVRYDRFEWDVPLAASLFQPKIEDDYTQLDMKLARPSEEALLNALDRFRTITGGQYPSDFSPVTAMSELFTMPHSEEGRKLLEHADQQQLIELSAEITAGVIYYMKLIREGREPQYFGDDVTADEGDKVLMRWNLDDGRVRVIYGDLHVATLPAGAVAGEGASEKPAAGAESTGG